MPQSRTPRRLGGNFWDHTNIRDAIPWPGETFVIVEKASGWAMTQTNGEL